MASTIEKSKRNQDMNEDSATGGKSGAGKASASGSRQKSRAGNFICSEMSCRTFARSIGC